VQAAEWIAEKWGLHRPIAPQRWQAIGYLVTQELQVRARAHNRSTEAELRASVLAALLTAFDEVGGILSGD
jgi:hypothetical protein